MPQQNEKWWKETYREMVKATLHGNAFDMSEMFTKLLAEARRRALTEAITIVEQGLKTGHGGGNWRRLYEQTLEALKNLMK